MAQSHRHINRAIAIAVDQASCIRPQGDRGIIDQSQVRCGGRRVVVNVGITIHSLDSQDVVVLWPVVQRADCRFHQLGLINGNHMIEPQAVTVFVCQHVT